METEHRTTAEPKPQLAVVLRCPGWRYCIEYFGRRHEWPSRMTESIVLNKDPSQAYRTANGAFIFEN